MSVGSPQGRGPLSWERAIPRPDRAWGSLGHAVLPQGLLGSHLQEAVTNVFWNSLQLTHSPLSVGPQTPPTWGWPAPRGSFSPEREGPSVSRPAARAAWCPPQQAGRVRRTRPPASHIPPRGAPGSLGAEPSLALRAGGGKVATPSGGSSPAGWAFRRPAPVPGGARWKGCRALYSGCGGFVGVQGPGTLGPGCRGPSGRRGTE